MMMMMMMRTRNWLVSYFYTSEEGTLRVGCREYQTRRFLLRPRFDLATYTKKFPWRTPVIAEEIS